MDQENTSSGNVDYNTNKKVGEYQSLHPKLSLQERASTEGKKEVEYEFWGPDPHGDPLAEVPPKWSMYKSQTYASTGTVGKNIYQDQDRKHQSLVKFVNKLLPKLSPEVPVSMEFFKSKSYVPQVVGLGFFHHEMIPTFIEMKEFKVKAVCNTVKRINGMTVEKLVIHVMELKEEISNYDLAMGRNDRFEVACIFTMDACFILEFFRSLCSDNIDAWAKTNGTLNANEKTGWKLSFDKRTTLKIMGDIFMLPNQIPLCVLLKILQLEFEMNDVSALSRMLILRPQFQLLPFSLKPSEAEVLQFQLEGHINNGANHLLDLLSNTIEHCLTPSSSSNTPSTSSYSPDYERFMSSYKANYLPDLLIDTIEHGLAPSSSSNTPSTSSYSPDYKGFFPSYGADGLAPSSSSNTPSTSSYSPDYKGFFPSYGADGLAPSSSSNTPSTSSYSPDYKGFFPSYGADYIPHFIPPSLESLQKFGIKFKPSINGEFRFEKRWFTSSILYVPQIHLDEVTEPLLRDLMTVEGYSRLEEERAISHFITFMNYLICSNKESVALLKEKRIIISRKVSDEELLETFENLKGNYGACGRFGALARQALQVSASEVIVVGVLLVLNFWARKSRDDLNLFAPRSATVAAVLLVLNLFPLAVLLLVLYLLHRDITNAFF